MLGSLGHVNYSFSMGLRVSGAIGLIATLSAPLLADDAQPLMFETNMRVRADTGQLADEYMEEGYLYLSSGERYEGEFLNGRLFDGMMLDAHGTLYIGRFQSGNPDNRLAPSPAPDEPLTVVTKNEAPTRKLFDANWVEITDPDDLAIATSISESENSQFARGYYQLQLKFCREAAEPSWICEEILQWPQY